MKTVVVRCLAFFLVLASATARADEPKDVAAGRKLVGTWKIVSAKYGGNEYTFPAGATTIKHVTPTHFMWVTYDADGKVTRCAGGTYTLKGNIYEEKPEYGLSADFDVIKGKPQTFKCKVQDGKWHHDGKLSNDLTIEEVWERVDKK